jgi:hypothetical protein
MPEALESPELVTGTAKVTAYDGLHGFEWRSLFRGVYTQTPVTTRHPSLLVVFYPRDAYDPQEARREAMQRPPGAQRDELLRYAAEAERSDYV